MSTEEIKSELEKLLKGIQRGKLSMVLKSVVYDIKPNPTNI